MCSSRHHRDSCNVFSVGKGAYCVYSLILIYENHMHVLKGVIYSCSVFTLLVISVLLLLFVVIGLLLF